MNKSIPNHSALSSPVSPRIAPYRPFERSGGKVHPAPPFRRFGKPWRYSSKTQQYSPYRKRSRIKAGHHLAAQPSTNARSAGVHMRGHENSAGAVSNVTIADI